MIGRLISRLWPQLDRLADAMLGVNCWWCGDPDPHDDETGCTRLGCGCSGLL